jgi:uncharacterized repeat protein (TIGR03803 family)
MIRIANPRQAKIAAIYQDRIIQENHTVNNQRMMRRIAPVGLAGLLLLATGTAAFAQDAFDAASHELFVPLLRIGTLEYDNMLVDVTNIVEYPNGNAPLTGIDSFSPATQQLTISTVNVGANTYYNPVVKLGAAVSIGGLLGANVYSDGSLLMPAVQVQGGALYTGVEVSIGPSQIQQVAGGLPRVSQNLYNTATRQLIIPAAEYNGTIYTNVTASVTAGQIQQVQGGPQLLDTLVYSFAGTGMGYTPNSGLVQGTDGNFYGTTNSGGSAGYGIVFQLTPSGQFTLLHSFGGNTTDGGNPAGPLVADAQGNFYGVATIGGAHGQGSVFKITPGGQETQLYSFSGNGGVPNSNDGATPVGLLLATDGNFYGTTVSGGTAGWGTVFKMTSSGSESILYSFVGGQTDGQSPQAGLVQGSDGNLYGTTASGGPRGEGTVFRISTGGTEGVLHYFTDLTDGSIPYSVLIQATDGNLYGTTYAGGSYGGGTVFRVAPTTGAETVLYSFSGGGAQAGSPDGAGVFTGVIQATDGDIYGSTNFGGAYNDGVVFRITMSGAATMLHSFTGSGGLAGSTDGAVPTGLLQASDGNLYGTAYVGGATGNGAVFKLLGAIH